MTETPRVLPETPGPPSADLLSDLPVISVRIVMRNFVPAMSWALLLSAATIGSILLLPLFPLVMPVMAYASHELYNIVLSDPIAGTH